jgi:hypothetical protein
MSDYLIRTYKELYGEIDILFEAVPVESTQTKSLEDVAQKVFVRKIGGAPGAALCPVIVTLLDPDTA